MVLILAPLARCCPRRRHRADASTGEPMRRPTPVGQHKQAFGLKTIICQEYKVLVVEKGQGNTKKDEKKKGFPNSSTHIFIVALQ